MVKKTAGSGPTIQPVEAGIIVEIPDPRYPIRTRDKVAIVGFADGHRRLAPWTDPTWEIWGLNRLHSAMTDVPFRADRWHEMHDLRKFYENDVEHREWMRRFPGPIYIRPQDVGVYDIPTAQPYPVNAILEDFGDGSHAYMTNSISWQVAMAIGMGFKEIALFGVDMAQDVVLGNEYRGQRPSVEFLIGYAVGKGITVHIPDGSDILKCSFMYGLEEGDATLLKNISRLQELNKRKDDLRAQLANWETQKMVTEKQMYDAKLALSAQINQVDGACQQVIYAMVNLSTPPEVAPVAQQ